MNNLENIMPEHQDIFDYFDEIYLFGSYVSNEIYSNDIDLLLIYEKYTNRIKIEKERIILTLQALLKKDIDVTLMSLVEFEQTKFLQRLNSPYKRLK